MLGSGAVVHSRILAQDTGPWASQSQKQQSAIGWKMADTTSASPDGKKFSGTHLNMKIMRFMITLVSQHFHCRDQIRTCVLFRFFNVQGVYNYCEIRVKRKC